MNVTLFLHAACSWVLPMPQFLVLQHRYHSETLVPRISLCHLCDINWLYNFRHLDEMFIFTTEYCSLPSFPFLPALNLSLLYFATLLSHCFPSSSSFCWFWDMNHVTHMPHRCCAPCYIVLYTYMTASQIFQWEFGKTSMFPTQKCLSHWWLLHIFFQVYE